MMTPKELAQYAKVCRKHGIASLEIGQVKFTLDTSHNPTQPASAQDEALEEAMSEDDLLTWSSSPAL